MRELRLRGPSPPARLGMTRDVTRSTRHENVTRKPLTGPDREPKQEEISVMFLPFTKIRLANMNGSKRPSSREIERKFLLKRFPPGLKKFPHDTIQQGYLAVGRGGLQVRLRKRGSVRSLTFKQGTKGAREER